MRQIYPYFVQKICSVILEDGRLSADENKSYLHSMPMEDETRAFFVLIVNTISLVLLWMIVNVLAGIYFGLGFFEKSPDWKNVVYYTSSLVALFFILRHIKRKWKL